MIKVTLEGFKEAVGSLKNMANGVPKNAGEILDKAASEVKDKMKSEAPVWKNILRQSVAIAKPALYIREIEPLARNIGGTGEKYAARVEEGSRPGYWPNITSLQMYTGGDEKMAWAMAAAIHQRGTPANPFVSRTFDWTESKLDSWGGDLTAKIVVDFAKG